MVLSRHDVCLEEVTAGEELGSRRVGVEGRLEGMVWLDLKRLWLMVLLAVAWMCGM